MPEQAFPRTLAATARAQAGAFSLDQARLARVDQKVLHRLAEKGVLDNRGHGVMVVAGAPRDDLQRAWSAVLSVGQPCALSAEWALWARGHLRTPPEGAPQIGVPDSRKLVARDCASIRRISWWTGNSAVEELRHCGGIPVLSAIDSIVTAARCVSDASLLAALQDAAFKGEVSVAELISRRRRGLPGSPRLGRVIATYLTGHDSAFEVTTYAVLTAGDTRGMHTNVILVDGQGRTLGPVDGYHEDGAAYEADGRSVHGNRRRRDRDRLKDDRAREMGVPLPRFDSRQISEGATARARWLGARAAARASGVGRRLTVQHLPGRGCCCGHRPTS